MKFKIFILIALLCCNFTGCDDTDCSSSYSEGYERGKSEGFEQGKQQGDNEGYNRGKSEGFQQGSDGGYSKGYSDGILKGKELEKQEHDTKIEELTNKHKEEIETITLQGSGNIIVSTKTLKGLRAILHIITLAGILAMGFFIIGQVRSSEDWLMRSILVAVAFFIVFLFVGVNFSPIDSISKAFGVTNLTEDRFWRILIVGVLGFLFAMVIHLVSLLHVTILERYMVLLSTLVLIFFLLIYIEGWSQPENLYLNASFIVGVAFYAGTFIWKNIGGSSPSGIFKSFYEKFK